ncbi:MAG: c-type cytochrome [Pseudomonadota bacterium]
MTVTAVFPAFALAAALLLAGPALQAQAPPAPVQDTMAQRMQACVVCHGKEGRATSDGYYPRIAGKPEGYLYNQLQHFKAGRRRNTAMGHLVQHLSDDYLREIAAYFAALDLPYPPARAPRLTPQEQATAEALVRQGAPERRLPACVSCHGAQMAGMLPATPGLLTLPADYLAGQLGAWRTGQRRAAEPDCMAEIARRLTPDEIAAIARWLSAQTLLAGTHAAPPPPAPLPLRCGSAAP